MRRLRVYARRVRKLRPAFSILAGLVFFAFFFYDGPLALPWQEVSAEAEVPTVNVLPEASPSLEASPQPSRHLVEPRSGVVPEGFTAEWRQVSLDHNQVQLQMLRKPFHLAQTSQQLGGESFEYASYLFGQMAESIHNPKLANELKTLSLEAQAMGNQISHAGAFRFAGPPNASMQHLQVRSSILYYLTPLTQNVLSRTPDTTSTKNMALTPKLTQLQTDSSKEDYPAGEMLQHFTQQVDRLLKQPDARIYPQTFRLISQESALLKKLAGHLSLHFENTHHQRTIGHPITTYTKIYAAQLLPTQTIAAVTL